MITASGTTLITNGQLIDGTGAAPIADAAVLIIDGRIRYAGPAQGAPETAADTQRIDANGGTILPGLVEAHYHPTYFNVAALEDLDIKYPVEYVSLLARPMPAWLLNVAIPPPAAAAASLILTSGSKRRSRPT
ncbi:MAG: hypothetical protein ACKVJG_17625 [Candidatus Latescibacterota bacterium]|jgi:imidazolonepropionase-like amidohydrolase